MPTMPAIGKATAHVDMSRQIFADRAYRTWQISLRLRKNAILSTEEAGRPPLMSHFVAYGDDEAGARREQHGKHEDRRSIYDA